MDSSRNIDTEFVTIDYLVKSQIPTRGVDAFILARVKTEKQLRRVFTYLIYQFPAFSENDKSSIVKVLADYTNLYFEDFVVGFDAVYCTNLRDLIGAVDYDRMWRELERIKKYRNKIFHGQLTGDFRSRSQLIDDAQLMRDWCRTTGSALEVEIGYDGFQGGSFQKNKQKSLVSNYHGTPIASIADLRRFIETSLGGRAARNRR